MENKRGRKSSPDSFTRDLHVLFTRNDYDTLVRIATENDTNPSVVIREAFHRLVAEGFKNE